MASHFSFLRFLFPFIALCGRPRSFSPALRTWRRASPNPSSASARLSTRRQIEMDCADLQRSTDVTGNQRRLQAMPQGVRKGGATRYRLRLHFLHSLLFIFPQQNNSACVRFEVFTAVTMKSVVFWGIRTQFVIHRRHITSPLQSSAS
jgi:hypothetical protein